MDSGFLFVEFVLSDGPISILDYRQKRVILEVGIPWLSAKWFSGCSLAYTSGSFAGWTFLSVASGSRLSDRNVQPTCLRLLTNQLSANRFFAILM